MQIKRTLFIILGLAALGLIIGIIILLQPGKGGGGGIAPCSPNEQLHTCPGREPQCGEICRSDQVWDCDQEKCVCKTGKSCENDTICCPVCDNDLCCSKDDQITPVGKTQATCCGTGAGPDSSKTKCVAYCGNSQKPCDDISECMNITGLSAKAYNDLKNAYENDPSWRGSTAPTSGKSDGQIFFCRQPSTCQFSNGQFTPELVNNTTPFYNFNGAYGTNGTELCFPTDPTTYPNKCFGLPSSGECGKEPDCTWQDIFTKYSQDQVNTEALLKKWIKYKGESESGYYCGDSTIPFGRLVTMPVSPGHTCTWQDCLNHISNTGTTQVNWDSENGRCHALKTIPGTAAGGIEQMVTCTDQGNPVPECSKAGDHVPGYIKCTGKGSPCNECEDEGKFVRLSNCTTQDWQFKPCTDNQGSINTQVLHWLCDGGDCSNCGTDKYCGNCPFGCNDTTDSSCYTQLSTMGNRGGLNSVGLACDSTGQYNNIGNKWVCSTDGACEQVSPSSPVRLTDRLYDTLQECKDAPCRATSPGTATAVAKPGGTCSDWPGDDCCYHCYFGEGENHCNAGYKPTLTKDQGSNVNCWFPNCHSNCCDSANQNCCDQAKSVAVCAESSYGLHNW